MEDRKSHLAKNGRLNMVQWLVQNGKTEGAEEVVHAACGGHLDIDDIGESLA